MRLCFLYNDKFAPYSKWFGRAFNELKIDEDLKRAIKAALNTTKLEERESFRQISYIREACIATISGRGVKGYLDAIDLLADELKGN